MKFKNWTITGVDTSELVLTNEELTFTMPAGNVTATANYDFIDYTVTVTGGMAKVNGGVASASVKAHYGDSITITAAAPETGKRFTGWTLEGVRVYDKTKAEITFTMPANAVTATANYDFESYEIKVTGGTAQVNGGGESRRPLITTLSTIPYQSRAARRTRRPHTTARKSQSRQKCP